ncbi:MAG: hypothetical protein AB1757_11925 [Acidobacteriota bacterium]
MAFVIKFADDNDFYANIDIKVGKGSGGWDDILLVKALLKLIYSPNKGVYKSPLPKPLTVSSRFDNSTAILIKHFQHRFQKMPRPDGVVSRTYERLISDAGKYTIIHLQLEAQRVLRLLEKPGTVLSYLRLTYPELVSSLSTKSAPGVMSEIASNEGGAHEIFRNP